MQRGILLAVGIIHMCSQITTVHRESAFAFPAIGLQLETHRGLYLFGRQFTTSVSRVFIPISVISDIIINEGLCGWNVRRYLAILSAREPSLQVVFENLDPSFDILREAYHGLRETLFHEWECKGPDADAEYSSTHE
ncbi:hypothetical protein FRC12_023490 [Ceratobasidium sp. 428]|nr:hypothetical protein FRC12_023490 [Ceratobasidium sp. 428]